MLIIFALAVCSYVTWVGVTTSKAIRKPWAYVYIALFPFFAAAGAIGAYIHTGRFAVISFGTMLGIQFVAVSIYLLFRKAK